MGRIWPGSLAANVSSPGPPAAVYSVMKSVPPATARPSAPRKPPCWPPAEVDVCIWIAIDIQDSWPDSAKTLSPGCMLSSSTGITVPTIFGSILSLFLGQGLTVGPKPNRGRSVVNVLQRRMPLGLAARRFGAGLAHPDDQHLGARGLEVVLVLEVTFEVGDQVLLDVHHPAADRADRVMVVAACELVMRGALAQVRGVQRTRSGQRLEPAVDGAARERRLGPPDLFGDLVGRAVAAEPDDGVVDHGPLLGAPHAYAMTRSERSACVSSRQPCASTTTSSSMRTPPQPSV